MPQLKDTYSSLENSSEGLYKELGSRFIAFAIPVETVDEVKAAVDTLRKKYHDARHCCFAYRIGLGGELWRAVDDGEPSSSAGRPILAAIDSEGLSDILVVVVRYFGGIKLGVPGLIRAYRTAATDALQSGNRIEKTAALNYRLRFDYLVMNDVMKMVKEMDLPQKNQDFSSQCSMELRVRLSQKESFEEKMSHISSASCELI